MERPRYLHALILAVALFAAPAAWACGQMLMWMGCCAGQESEQEAAAPCHSSDDAEASGIDTGAADMDCCAADAAAAPLQAVSFQNDVRVAGLEPSTLQSVPTAVPTRAEVVPIDCWRLHDPGRYTLFSSFLL